MPALSLRAWAVISIDLADHGVPGHAPGLDGQGPELIERPGQDLIAGPLVDRHALAGEGADVDGGAALDDHAVDRHPRPRLDDDAVADTQRRWSGRGLPGRRCSSQQRRGQTSTILRMARCVRSKVKASRHSPTMPMNTTSAATSGSPNDDGGDAGDGQGQVGPDPAFVQA